MSTIQNLKNFIRHGKQARVVDPPRDQPTTNVSPVHVQQQKYQDRGIAEAAISERQQHQYPGAVAPQPGQYSAAAAVAQAAQGADNRTQKVPNREAEIQAIVAEEREKASRLPRYAGLELYVLLEKMGDGAFSNVYKAKDTRTGQEVAIKVVRKFEMNSTQVCPATVSYDTTFPLFPAAQS